jgi:transposase
VSTARSSNAIELIELRTRAGYYRAMHARAVQREARLKRESVASRVIARKRRVIIKQRDASIRKLKAVIRERDRIIAEHDAKVEALKARIVWLEKKVFGRSTEKTGARPEDRCSDGAPGRQGDEAPGAATDDESTGRGRRRRGQQPGAPGHGRRPRTELPAETCSHELPDGVPCCAKCGKPYRPFGTEDSEQIEYEVRVYRRVHRRSRYSRACDCDRVPAVVTAPVPAKVIPKGMFAVSFWVHVILEKYLFQRPLNRVLATLELESLSLSQGTITEGLRRIGELLRPVYCRILERARRAARWKMDETGWSVFVEMEGKTGYHWWLWVVITDETVVYLLEPTRSGEVPRNFLGDDPEGSLLVDRYAVYQNLGPRLLVAFCWSHIRRDFVNVGEQYEYLALWAGWWVERINRLFAINDERVAVRDDPQAFAVKDVAVREAVAEMEQACDRELAGTGLRLVQRKTLKRLKKHWAGATLFVDHPEIPMDNNESERMLRDPVMGRKNYFGCGSLWSGELTSSCFSIFQTLLKNGVDPKQWLTAYLDACAHSGGKAPDDVDAFLPWNMTEERKVEWRYPSRPPRTPPQSGTAVVSLPLPTSRASAG